MIYHGWAFGHREGQMDGAQIRARYAEIKHLKKEFEWGGRSCYAHNIFRATAKTPEAESLSDMDVLILADDGNLCFGGECSKTSTGFSGSYNTD